MNANSLSDSRIMRIAAWMWLIYQVAQIAVDLFIYAVGPISPIFWYHFWNMLPAVCFLAVAYSPFMERWAAYSVPGMILLISTAPILVYHLLGLRLPPAPLSNIEGITLRQLPVLFIGLVLVAWHYRLATMVGYSIGLNIFEMTIVVGIDRLGPDQMTAFTFITIIRAICFIVVGIFINQLILLLRAERESLREANRQIAHYASALETLAVSRERNRMSRELHDTVVHTLSGLAIQLETAKAYWTENPETAKSLLDQSLDAARSGLQETRRALGELRASPLEDLGLFQALQQLVKNAADRARMEWKATLPDQPLVLSPDVEQSIYRIAQEAAENVVHHANAKHIRLSLSLDHRTLELIVQDDGIGFAKGSGAVMGHYGLAGMKERAELAGGKLLIASEPGKGTTIRYVLEGMGR